MTTLVTKYGLRVLLGLAGLCALVVSARAQSREVFGYAGVLGEWGIIAAVDNEFSGTLTMTHIGMCTQDGPEQKTGEIRLQLSAFAPELRAALVLAGVACTFTGTLSDAYKGLLSCADKPAMPLTLWIK
jgi:hypothetical protein